MQFLATTIIHNRNTCPAIFLQLSNLISVEELQRCHHSKWVCAIVETSLRLNVERLCDVVLLSSTLGWILASLFMAFWIVFLEIPAAARWTKVAVLIIAFEAAWMGTGLGGEVVFNSVLNAVDLRAEGTWNNYAGLVLWSLCCWSSVVGFWTTLTCNLGFWARDNSRGDRYLRCTKMFCWCPRITHISSIRDGYGSI